MLVGIGLAAGFFIRAEHQTEIGKPAAHQQIAPDDRLTDLERQIATLSEIVVTVSQQLNQRLIAAERQSHHPAVQLATITEAEGGKNTEAPKSQIATSPDPVRSELMQAFQTLDEQLQIVRQRLEVLAKRDQALTQAQEAIMVAVQTELTNWRERHSPPIWDLTAQLAGVTVRFQEGSRYGNPAAAEAALQQVSTLLLASDPSLGLRVVGYADFDGTDPKSNRITAQKRANAVMQELERRGVPAERLIAVGRATEHRVVDSDSAGNANRRVVFEPFLLKNTGPLAN